MSEGSDSFASSLAVNTLAADHENGHAMYATNEAAAGQATGPALTGREVEVLRTWLICDSKEAAGRSLFIGAATVNTHIARIRGKYDAVGRPAATKSALLARALQDGLISIEEL
jgi:DNA-binding CsgD family transcriptional regulator